MAKVIPFRGIRYNPDKVGDPSLVLAPPYDIITPQQKEDLYRNNPFNIVQVDFGKDFETDTETDNRYTRAAGLLKEWLDSGVLLRDDRPFFYCYEVTYGFNGQEKRFRGLLGLVAIEPFESGVVLPHEETRSKPKTDRLNLMRATGANISPIFSLYSSGQRVTSAILEGVAAGTPEFEGRDSQGSMHRLWRIEDGETAEAISREFSDLPVFIADGHHRYETALEYMRERQGGEACYVMMFLANMEESGLTVLPTHRMLKSIPDDALARLERVCRLSPLPMTPEDPGPLECLPQGSGHRFAMYLGGGRGYLLELDRGCFDEVAPPLGELDVTVLHRMLFEKVLGTSDFAYEKDPAMWAVVLEMAWPRLLPSSLVPRRSLS